MRRMVIIGCAAAVALGVSMPIATASTGIRVGPHCRYLLNDGVIAKSRFVVIAGAGNHIWYCLRATDAHGVMRWNGVKLRYGSVRGIGPIKLWRSDYAWAFWMFQKKATGGDVGFQLMGGNLALGGDRFISLAGSPAEVHGDVLGLQRRKVSWQQSRPGATVGQTIKQTCTAVLPNVAHAKLPLAESCATAG